MVAACVFFSCSMNIYAGPQEKILKEDTLSASQNNKFCQQLAEFCQDRKPSTLYRVKGHPEQFYVIQNLKLVAIGLQQNNYKILNQWDFSKYQPLSQKSRWAFQYEGDEIENLSIFPTLFPISEQDYAVGIVQSWQEGYSGGGMFEEVVDFLQLKESGQYQQVFQNIPLSMYRMIRACFSEADYNESNGKCHDEYRLDTQIFYVKPYTWHVKYHYQADYSPASDSGTKSVSLRKSFILNDNRDDAIILPETWE